MNLEPVRSPGGGPSCSLTSLLTLGCRSRAESLAQKLHNKLWSSLGSPILDDSSDPSAQEDSHRHSWVTLEARAQLDKNRETVVTTIPLVGSRRSFSDPKLLPVYGDASTMENAKNMELDDWIKTLSYQTRSVDSDSARDSTDSADQESDTSSTNGQGRLSDSDQYFDFGIETPDFVASGDEDEATIIINHDDGLPLQPESGCIFASPVHSASPDLADDGIHHHDEDDLAYCDHSLADEHLLTLTADGEEESAREQVTDGEQWATNDEERAPCREVPLSAAPPSTGSSQHFCLRDAGSCESRGPIDAATQGDSEDSEGTDAIRTDRLLSSAPEVITLDEPADKVTLHSPATSQPPMHLCPPPADMVAQLSEAESEAEHRLVTKCCRIDQFSPSGRVHSPPCPTDIETEHRSKVGVDILLNEDEEPTNAPDCHGSFDLDAKDDASRCTAPDGGIDGVGVDAIDVEEEAATTEPYLSGNEAPTKDTLNVPDQNNHPLRPESDDDEDSVRDNNRLIRVGRSTSLKSGKTPPGTPGHKKIVRFADALGLDLALVRTFLDEIPNVPQSAFSDLSGAQDNTDSPDARNNSLVSYSGPYQRRKDFPLPVSSPSPQRSLIASFSQPNTSPAFIERLKNQKVCLEAAHMVENMTVRGSVRVLNMDFHKTIMVRYTINDWLTVSEVPATYIPNSCDGLSDRFSFTLFAYGLQPGQRLLFAICYRVSGHEFWDNNNGTNYVFQCISTSSHSLASSFSPLDSPTDRFLPYMQ